MGAHVVRLVFVAAALVENRKPGAKWIDAERWRRRLDAITCTDQGHKRVLHYHFNSSV